MSHPRTDPAGDPSRAAEETIARIADLAMQAMRAQADLAKQSLDLSQAAMRSEVDPSAASRAWIEAVSRESARYWTEVSALGLDVAGQLIALGNRSMARVVQDTREATRAPMPPEPASAPAPQPAESTPAESQPGESTPGESTPTAEPRRGAVRLHGRVDEHVHGTITLANQHNRARRVLIEAGRLTPVSGRHVLLQPQVDPEGVTIPAQGEQTIAIDVHIDPLVANPGEQYTGILTVSGGVEAVVDVTVDVED